MTQSASVTATGVRVPARVTVPVDLLLDEVRVWSFQAARDGMPAGDDLEVAWPPQLARFLDGVARVRLVAGDETLLDHEQRFGTASTRIRVVDDDGRPVSIDKGGRLQRDFDATSAQEKGEIVDAVNALLADLRGRWGLDAFLSFGCLLGAVRTGHLIGHDSDADVSFLSRHTHPFDVAREFRTLGHLLRRQGYDVREMSAAHLKVEVPLTSGGRCGLDVFGAYYLEDVFFMLPSVSGPLPRSALLPTSTVVLEGRDVVAPADPERLLELTYGPHWRVPDPSFTFAPDRAVVRHVSGLWRGEEAGLRAWEDAHRVAQEHEASTARPGDDAGAGDGFAAWVHARVEPGSPVVELGCGSGADAARLAALGHPVVATDFAAAALDRARARAAALPPGSAALAVRRLNLLDLREVLRSGAELARAERPAHLVARSVVEELPQPARDDLWRMARMAQRRGGRTFLEVPLDTPQVRKRGGRRPPPADPDLLTEQITDAGGRVVDRETGTEPRGRTERMVVRWDR
ncbi:MAG: methyltransferase domain-containing protein [Nocardioidaceae bacterium]